jgi:hypothetical protein
MQRRKSQTIALTTLRMVLVGHFYYMNNGTPESDDIKTLNKKDISNRLTGVANVCF